MLIPNPIKKNIKNNIVEVCVKATVIAVPTKGAVHGVANKVAKNPLKKFFVKKLFPNFKILESLTNIGNSTSYRPKVLKQKVVNTNNIKIKKYGSWNCIPQATERSIFFSIRKQVAKNKNDTTIPIAV